MLKVTGIDLTRYYCKQGLIIWNMKMFILHIRILIYQKSRSLLMN